MTYPYTNFGSIEVPRPQVGTVWPLPLSGRSGRSGSVLASTCGLALGNAARFAKRASTAKNPQSK